MDLVQKVSVSCMRLGMTRLVIVKGRSLEETRPVMCGDISLMFDNGVMVQKEVQWCDETEQCSTGTAYSAHNAHVKQEASPMELTYKCKPLLPVLTFPDSARHTVCIPPASTCTIFSGSPLTKAGFFLSMMFSPRPSWPTSPWPSVRTIPGVAPWEEWETMEKERQIRLPAEPLG